MSVIAWQGYDTPEALVSSETRQAGRAVEAAGDVVDFTAGLRASAAEAGADEQRITLVGHRYGSRAAAEAVRADADVDDLVLLGSPGTGDLAVDGLGFDADHVWAARNDDDEIRFATNPVTKELAARDVDLGHDRDPTDPEYGAQVLRTGGGRRHPDYFRPDTAATRVVAVIEGDYEAARR